MRLRSILLGGVMVVSAASTEAAVVAKSLVVCLPATTVESASRLGSAVTDLGAYLDKRVPGLELTVRPFRRAEDAMSYVQSQGRDVALLLTDPLFLLDLPADFVPVPIGRLVRGGKEAQRKIVVMAAGVAATGSLSDLKGHSLSLAVPPGEHASRFLARVIFESAIVPESWFAKLVPETDEFTATANVLFGRTDGALVSEDNPLVLSHLGKELKTVYSSPPVSLPVVSLRSGALSGIQATALEAALVSLAGAAEGKSILEGLGTSGFARVKEGSGPYDRAGLLAIPAEERRQPEVAVLAARDLALPALSAPESSQLPFLLGLTVPDLPVPVLEAAKSR